jgi:hypothetical protein
MSNFSLESFSPSIIIISKYQHQQFDCCHSQCMYINIKRRVKKLFHYHFINENQRRKDENPSFFEYFFFHQQHSTLNCPKPSLINIKIIISADFSTEKQNNNTIMMMIMTIFMAEHYEFIKDERKRVKEIGKNKRRRRRERGKFNDFECEFEQ